ncbi:hypothetical protein JRQ81_008035 [Phrynocephalus forsythii]|uniref:Vacuolar protein 8 n=1 Tax=Phrynocephalus forsythii TaxID=171643 RepID=A0A9Q0Y541_9SAUR|nr:hypothetical protein JRQ81_008035 [Phrynocephalus forsythii]
MRTLRMGQLCAKCAQLLCDFALQVKKFSAGLMFDIRECIAQVLNCPCLQQSKFGTRQLYKPAFRTQEEEIAQEFLQHIEKGLEASPLSKVSLEALRTLAFSENPSLQLSAASYYLQISQDTNIQLPPEHLETYYALLKSNDLEVQQISSLSLLNFLLEGNDVNREAIARAGGVIPLLSLSKSYNPRVQQNAVGAIFNLTQSEWIQQILFQQGALPILLCLLESPDSEVQYYSCAALSNMAIHTPHHDAMLHIGNRFLLRALFPLLSSPVEKVANQACVCLRNLATNESVQTSIVALPILPHLFPLLASDNTELQQNTIILLRLLSQHPVNQDKLLCDEVLQIVGKRLLAWKTHPVVIGHAACFIQNLSCSESIPKIIKSPCIEGLLQAVLSADLLEEESLSCVISCLAELLKHERAMACILELTDEALIGALLQVAGQVKQTETSFQTAFMIKCMIQHGKATVLLKQHMEKVQEYLMKYLSHQENRFQQLGISTLCLLQKESEFLSTFSQCQMKKYLDQIHQQTEETQELLSTAIQHMNT